MSESTGFLSPPRADLTITDKDGDVLLREQLERQNTPRAYKILTEKAPKKAGLLKGIYLDSAQQRIIDDFKSHIGDIDQNSIGHFIDQTLRWAVYPTPGQTSLTDVASYGLQSFFIDVSRKGTGQMPLFNELFAICIEIASEIIIDSLSTRGVNGHPQSLVRQGFEKTKGPKTPVGAFEQIFDDISREALVKWKKQYPNMVDETRGAMFQMLGEDLGRDAAILYKELKRQRLSEVEISQKMSDLKFVSEFTNDKLKPVGIAIQVLQPVPSATQAGQDSPNLGKTRTTEQMRQAAVKPERN